MDEVPYDFIERLAAFWKRCGKFSCCAGNCDPPDCQWTARSKKQCVNCYIGTENGKLKYGFNVLHRVRDVTVSKDKMKKDPNLKHSVIRNIIFQENIGFYKKSLLDLQEIDLKDLMRFVTYLSNEPNLRISVSEEVCNAQGRTIISWLQEMHFAKIEIHAYNSCFDRLLEKQFSRRNVTPIDVKSVTDGSEFLQRELASLRLQKLHIHNSTYPPFPVNVLREIIERFLEDPTQFNGDYKVRFLSVRQETQRLLQEVKDRTCMTVDGTKYRLKSQNGPGTLEMNIKEYKPGTNTCFLYKLS